VQVIHNFIDPSVYERTRWRHDLRDSLPPGHKVVMHTSNFRAVKCVRDVVRIFARVRAAMPATLVMVGDGPDRGVAEEEARDLGIDRDVRFLGRIEAVAPLLASADLFLLPSQTESFGLSALEALATGVPVIASDVGGLREVIRDTETGCLLPFGDTATMADAAIGILSDAERWNRMSVAAQRDARERFAIDAIVDRYEMLYRSAVPA
jgi:N-acetyl-alpha-D-glucosaminyl L-malate synthase BshA